VFDILIDDFADMGIAGLQYKLDEIEFILPKRGKTKTKVYELVRVWRD